VQKIETRVKKNIYFLKKPHNQHYFTDYMGFIKVILFTHSICIFSLIYIERIILKRKNLKTSLNNIIKLNIYIPNKDILLKKALKYFAFFKHFHTFVLMRIMRGTISRHELEYDNIFKKYYKPLVIFASKYVDDINISEDIVQDVFISIWKKQDKLLDKNYLSAYLYRCVYNSCLTYLNKNKKIRIEEINDKIISDENVLNSILETEVYSEIISLLDQLPPKCQRIYRLNLQGLKTPEIAEDLDIAVDTVRSQIKRAKQILREKSKKYHSLLVLYIRKIYYV
jgi:RNA polymerase sigma-70 factor (ECF subfamily)